jgi:hypothetical protein
MKKHKTAKKIVVLPPDFQEVLISNEMKLNKEITINTVKNLIYLYSVINFIKKKLGMEYYDSINKKEFHQYYLDKSNKLLQNPTIIELLETKTQETQQEEKKIIEPVMKKEPLPRKSISNINLPVIDPNDYEVDSKRMKRAPTMKNIGVSSRVFT